MKLPDEQRFVIKTTRADNGCLLWTAALNTKGYPLFTVSQPAKKMRLAHRYWYEIQVGPIPQGMDLDHECHTRSNCTAGDACQHRRCVEPTHLSPVTHRENLLRGRGTPGLNAAKTHCLNGHPLDGENVYVIPSSGSRQCRTCRAEYRISYRAANRSRINAYNQRWQADKRAEAVSAR
jgi:hypothetical protein